MIYYVILYFTRAYAENRPWLPYSLCTLVILVWYLFEDSNTLFMYGETEFKWLFNFLFMLTGAYIGAQKIELYLSPPKNFGMLILCVGLFYGIQVLANRYSVVSHFQIITLFTLIGTVVYLYKFCCVESLEKLMRTKLGMGIRFISGLCLEAYIVQYVIIDLVQLEMKLLFPLNVVAAFVFIIISSYIVRCIARLFLQIFQSENMDWRQIVQIVD